ncbi:MAG: cytochrome c oxidase accessory protein CcoG [Deltaproteobacteria bacterium]|nr:MAG: cytochrome c oxidase accessory protein CcoG [Deltaproteobacteria bacterium]
MGRGDEAGRDHRRRDLRVVAARQEPPRQGAAGQVGARARALIAASIEGAIVSPPLPHHRILSTLNEDGTRNWIRPKLARGRFLRRRRIVAWALIALFVALPLVRIGGRPALLIDLVTRELSAFGAVFRPSNGFLLLLLGLTIVLAVFVLTALLGRVWCGWGCPHTVYLEHVFRPIERWLEGTPAQQARLSRFAPRRLIKWAIYAALAFAIANVFLAYFVGVDRLRVWVLESPAVHTGGFGVVALVTVLMLANFGWFREQTCIVACPYGRLQSVLLDRQSLIVGYDARRGEPRTKAKKLAVATGARGDCVDCSACVAVCPTGIDIRDGLQMECVGCAQCIDACDAVMDKLHRPRHLIGYTSQDQLAGVPRKLLRPRLVVYPALLAIVGSLFVWAVASRATSEVTALRNDGPSFVTLPDGRIASAVQLKIENESDEPRHYVISLAGSPDAVLKSPLAVWEIRPHHAQPIPLYVEAAASTFHHGERRVHLRIFDDQQFERIVTVTLLGPDGGEADDRGRERGER